MNNPVGDTIEAFIKALDSIVYLGDTITAYSIPPNGQLGNYIEVHTPTTTELGCKTIIGHEATIQVDIITQFAGNFGTPKVAEDITNLVVNAIRPKPGSVLTVNNFDMITLMLTNSISDTELFGTNRSYRKILTWTFLIDDPTGLPWILDLGTWNDGGIWKDTSVWID